MCSGTGKSWVKKNRKTTCPECNKTISQIGGHPMSPVPKH